MCTFKTSFKRHCYENKKASRTGRKQMQKHGPAKEPRVGRTRPRDSPAEPPAAAHAHGKTRRRPEETRRGREHAQQRRRPGLGDTPVSTRAAAAHAQTAPGAAGRGSAAGVGSGSARGSGRARSRRHATPAARPAVPGRNTGRRTGPCPRTMQPLRPRSPDVRPRGKRVMNHPQNGRPLGDRKEHTLTPARTSPNTRAE